MELEDYSCDKKHIEQSNVDKIEGFLGCFSNPCCFLLFERARASREHSHFQVRH